MNLESTFQKREIEVYFEDLHIIRHSLHEVNIAKFSHNNYLKLDEMDIHRWTSLKSFYDKVLVPKIEKGKPAKKGVVKLQLLPSQQLSLFHALHSLEEKSLDLVRILGIIHHSLINIPHLDYKIITTTARQYPQN